MSTKDYLITFVSTLLPDTKINITFTVDMTTFLVVKATRPGDITKTDYLYPFSAIREVRRLEYDDPTNNQNKYKVYSLRLGGDTTIPGILYDNVFNPSMNGVSKYGIALDIGRFVNGVVVTCCSSTNNVSNDLVVYAYKPYEDTISQWSVKYRDVSTFSYVPSTISCFGEYSQISTDIGYKRIQDLVPGMLIETFLDGYKPLKCLGKRYVTFFPSETLPENQLYCYMDTGLQITGKHCILVNELTDYQKWSIINMYGKIQRLDELYLLPAMFDDNATPTNIIGVRYVYHIVLESDTPNRQYGIFANGIIVETCSYNDFINYSYMERVN